MGVFVLQVWQGSRPGSTSPHVMETCAALQPYKDNRPVNGGPGCTEELVTASRGLNFELD